MMIQTGELRPRFAEMLGSVREAMTSKVMTVPPDMPASEAAIAMGREGVAGAPVVEEGRVVGVVTLGDMLDKVGHAHAQTSGPFLRADRHLTEFHVADLMTREVVTVGPDMPLARAVVLMDEAGVNRLPVIDAYGRVAGILARDDVMRVLARVLREKDVPPVHLMHPSVPHPEHPLMPPD